MKSDRTGKFIFTFEAFICVVLVALIIIQCISLPQRITKVDGEKESQTGNQTGNLTGNQQEEQSSKASESETEAATESKESAELTEDDVEKYVSNLLSHMRLEEKIAQLFIVTPEALVENKADPVVSAGAVTKKALKEYPVGGLIYFPKNFESEKQTKDMLAGIREMSSISLFLCVDEEGGSVARIANSGLFGVKKYPDMGNLKNDSEAYLVGNSIGTYLSEIGFNLDFAPVADVNTNPDNSVIGKRAFSSDAETAAAYVVKCVKGFKDSSTLCTLKHFPGHGDTKEDSHTELATTDKTLAELKETEFLPFVSGIEAGADLVMVGHIVATEVDNSEPASLSETMINGVLRGELGYDGLVVTDALNMAAITKKYDSAEAAVKAIQAGCDLLLMPEDFVDAYDGLIFAVKNGKISDSRIDQSVRRILTKKVESGIIDITK